uniref:hypothetical protein n=1 Tax=Salmonella sp. TaxID=599 RepID=UPI001CD932C8|nr:hypothetical protein [Salmonella sp.]
MVNWSRSLSILPLSFASFVLKLQRFMIESPFAFGGFNVRFTATIAIKLLLVFFEVFGCTSAIVTNAICVAAFVVHEQYSFANLRTVTAS